MTFFRKSFLIFLCIFFIFSCKVKNPLGKEKEIDPDTVNESGEVTANVISVHTFFQRPYEMDSLNDGLSNYMSQTYVATPESSYESVSNPAMGCRKAGSTGSGVVVTRFLNIGDIIITNQNGELSQFQNKEISSIPYVFLEAFSITAGLHNLESTGLADEILKFSQNFEVPSIDPNIHLEIDDGNSIQQPLAFPTYDPEVVVQIDRDRDAIIHVNPPSNVNYIKVKLGDNNEISQECYFKPSTQLRIPSSVLSKIGSISETSQKGLIHIDFVTRALHQDSHQYVRQLYIETIIRHTQGFEDYGNFLLQSGVLEFL